MTACAPCFSFLSFSSKGSSKRPPAKQTQRKNTAECLPGKLALVMCSVPPSTLIVALQAPPRTVFTLLSKIQGARLTETLRGIPAQKVQDFLWLLPNQPVPARVLAFAQAAPVSSLGGLLEGAPMQKILDLLLNANFDSMLHLLQTVSVPVLCDLVTQVQVKTLVDIVAEVPAKTISFLLNMVPSQTVCMLLNRSPVGVSIVLLSLPPAISLHLVMAVDAELLAEFLESLPDIPKENRSALIGFLTGATCCTREVAPKDSSPSNMETLTNQST